MAFSTWKQRVSIEQLAIDDPYGHVACDQR